MENNLNLEFSPIILLLSHYIGIAALVLFIIFSIKYRNARSQHALNPTENSLRRMKSFRLIMILSACIGGTFLAILLLVLLFLVSLSSRGISMM